MRAMTLSFLVALVLCFAGEPICAMGQDMKAEPQESNMLTFSIQTDKQAYRFGEPILLRGTWENRGEDGLSMNRMFFAVPEVNPWRGESDSWRGVSTSGYGVALKMTAPSGARIPQVLSFIEMGFPHAGWFIYLRSKEGFFSKIADLWEEFGSNLTEEGTYHITATYFNFIERKNFIEKEPDLPYGKEPWTGTVESNTIVIALTKQTKKKGDGSIFE